MAAVSIVEDGDGVARLSTIASRKGAAPRCWPTAARLCCRCFSIPPHGARCFSAWGPASPPRRRPQKAHHARSACRLQPSASTQHFRFKVNFSGSHDDTRAALEATLDGAPFDCADGSKTNTESEDGEVSLDCRFTVAANPAAPAVLVVAVRWHHAQYMGYTLSVD